MSDHPSIDALHAHLDAPDADLRAHLDGCGDCRSRTARLAAGLATVDEARRNTPVPPAWERLDEVLAREAESVSRDIRSGRLRPSPRVPSWVATTLAMAAGAGLLLGGRAYLHRHDAPVAPVVAVHRPAPTPAPVVAPTLTPYEGVVLMAAGGAQYRENADAQGVALARTTGLHEGASVETPAAGRAVFTVRSNWTADVRGGSALKLSQFRAEETSVTLDRGEVALAPAAGESEPVRLLNNGWSVESHGPVTARVGATSLRVVVLAGRTDIRRGGAPALTVTGPLVVELPFDGSAPSQSNANATDPSAIELAVLAAAGTAFDIPPIDPTAVLTLLNHGALPSALESVRLGGPGILVAHLGRTEMRLELRPGAPLRWMTFHSATGPVVALNRVAAAPSVVMHPPVEQAPDLSPGALRALSQTTASRLQHCVQRYLLDHGVEGVSGLATFEVPATGSGQVTLSSLDPALEPAHQCFADDARFIPAPRSGNIYEFRVRFGSSH